MHLGEIIQIGTPPRAVRKPGREANRASHRGPEEGGEQLSEGAGPDKDIVDVQRFGDRLDLLVRDPDKARKLVTEN